MLKNMTFWLLLDVLGAIQSEAMVAVQCHQW